MKKYILTIFLIAFTVLPLQTNALTVEKTREQIMIQLIQTLTELVKQLQTQLAIELAKQQTIGIGSPVMNKIEPLTVIAKDRPADNRNYFGGNCDTVVLYTSEKAEVYIPESKTWVETDQYKRFIWKPQATSTKETLVFLAGDKRVEYEISIGEAIDREKMTGVPFDYQLGKCK